MFSWTAANTNSGSVFFSYRHVIQRGIEWDFLFVLVTSCKAPPGWAACMCTIWPELSSVNLVVVRFYRFLKAVKGIRYCIKKNAFLFLRGKMFFVTWCNLCCLHFSFCSVSNVLGFLILFKVSNAYDLGFKIHKVLWSKLSFT